mmetsp:Transcript_9349/g.23558  ORF Transcript_9349/g.23558 Transcript_9349/m.23558 type:complete len:205 (+) Transcript_9349:2309-2923(+)
MASGGRAAIRAKFSRSMLRKLPEGSEAMEAVASRTSRPSMVAGRDVPGREPLNAVSTVICPPVPGREPVPGRAKPVKGRPDELTGRMLWSSPAPLFDVCGRCKDVPGRGMDAVAFSSSRISPTPSSSISVSSMYASAVSALHFRKRTAWSRGFVDKISSHDSIDAAYFRRRQRDMARKSGSHGDTVLAAAMPRLRSAEAVSCAV